MTGINQLLKFTPILKEKIWGGEKLISMLNKVSDKKNIGESWEISDVEEDVSVVANGAFKGESLKELIVKFKGDLVGNKVYNQFGEKFPLLIKFIDAKEALSIQLHPNDKLAKERHNSFGKTEMWYIMQADKFGNLVVGFKKDTNKEKYLYHLKNKSLLSILNVDEVKKGDVYFIPTGRVHAIGAGVLLAEVQQTSDITYRVYDWDRKDEAGKHRDLHTEQALDAIDYTSQKPYKTKYKKKDNEAKELVSCPFFTTNIISLKEQTKLALNHIDKDSFVIYMCVEGAVEFLVDNNSENLKMGETLLVPACIKELVIQSEIKSELLEVFIK
ncbi:type I phosphomannose isomerase catalytic subunit [Tenacibaculum aquimarinum]|uniref:type I phosphomannose isomerase catalytic subunit n=1 Tax=Tenacibaculum aquimarinum TaxID=2910675 RepID=UPI001F0B6B83|nr:type I phosphomannose isomerase catalytic subunit [Tenacibaculum aquimarinum]MCH3885519.1 class I mannose-6-phosphate isomerase [Tenacibaculum aquimarinum]